MALGENIDAHWWRTKHGRSWHILAFHGDDESRASEPWYSLCGISKFQFVQGEKYRQGPACQRCLAAY